MQDFATLPISMDGTDPAMWDPALDGVVAAPGHHEVLYEDEKIRVISVTVRPGEMEPLHHHARPSIFVIDSLPKLVDFDAEGREIPLPLPLDSPLPLTAALPPQPLHRVRNDGTVSFHGTRIEFKQVARLK